MPDAPVVHVIDDDPAMRDSLTFLLTSAKMRVATYESAASFLNALPAVTSGCIVTDVRMPDMSGIDLLRQLKTLGVPLPVIVVTGHGDVPLAVSAMRLGAAEFLEKPFDDDLMIAAIRAALVQHRRPDAADARALEVQQRLGGLSARERQVLDGLVAGKPNKTIAYDLGISPRTVEVYRANVMTKMNAPSLSALVRMAITAGVLDDA
jgi:two-component system response regulator FixJ